MISVCFVTVSSASFPGVDLDLDILFFTYTSIATKYHIYNMVYNNFDITTNFGNEFLIINMKSIFYMYLQVS